MSERVGRRLKLLEFIVANLHASGSPRNKIATLYADVNLLGFVPELTYLFHLMQGNADCERT